MLLSLGNFPAIDDKNGAAGIRIEKKFISFDNLSVHFAGLCETEIERLGDWVKNVQKHGEMEMIDLVM